MSLSMYQASVPAFVQILNNLSAILDKAEAYAKNRKIDPEVLLNYRLAPDMLDNLGPSEPCFAANWKPRRGGGLLLWI